jgi:hypothetical protein
VPGQPRAARTLQTPVPSRGLGETLEPDDDAVAKALAALPFAFAGRTVGAGVVPFPRLTVKQYASLREELSLWPAWAPQILHKYHVMHEAALEALDAHWEKQLVEQPGLRAEYEAARAEFAAWLRSRWG